MKEYRAYIFDLYGTLVDIHTDEEDPELWFAFSCVMNEYGVQYKPQELKKAYAGECLCETALMNRIIQDRGLVGPPEINILHVWQSIAQGSGLTLTESQLNHISEKFRQLSTRKIKLFDGARDLLILLKKHDKQVILLTNAQASFTRPELEKLGIAQSFDRIIISSECGFKKPSPEIYSHLWCDGLTPETSVMIGNDDVCDCWGAANVGMDSIYIPTQQSPELNGPLPENCRRISSLSEIF